MEYGILGPLTVRIDERPVDLGGRRQRAVLAVLLLDRNGVVSVDRLLDLVWDDDPPPTAETALQGHISKLRRLLGADRIETAPPGYRLRVGPGELDADRFEALVTEADGRSPRRAAALLREALGLWRGPVLADLGTASFTVVEAARLDEARLAAIETRIDADFACGRHDQVTAELDMLVADHPYRERFHALRMLGLYRAGRQADALAAFATARTVLDDGLGIDPGAELQALEIAILQQDPALLPPTPPASPTIHLPLPPSALLGRAEVLADLVERLRGEVRLVTLTGPGGTGKTRLAIEAAHRLAADADDGAWFVDLAAATEADHAIATIQAALGIPDAGGDDPLGPLRSFLRDKRALLVLDNLEQVLAVAPTVAALLAEAPGLRIIATSRAPLRVGAEQEWPVAPLAVGTVGQLVELDALPPAVALFVERARASVPGFTITEAAARTVLELCRRLDGLPLAIELAASRIRLLTPAAILERLGADLGVLRADRRDLPSRQRTLEATIGWSHDLLDPVSRAAFRATSVFAGGFTLEAFAAVCVGPDDDALERLADLIDGSLVGRVEPPRFAMLETIRRFAAGLLTGEEEIDVRARHVAFHLALATRATAELGGPDESTWLPVLRSELDNLRGALDWLAATGRHDELVELVGVLSKFWLRHGLYLEGASWITRALDTGAGTPRARAAALRNGASIASIHGRPREALELAQASVRSWESIGDVGGLADALRVEAMLYGDLGELALARRSADLAIEHARSIGDEMIIRTATNDLAFFAVQDGEVALAARLLEENALAMRGAGDRSGLAGTLNNLATLYGMLGDATRGEAAAREAVDELRHLGDASNLGAGLGILGSMLARLGRYGEAREAAAEGLGIVWEVGAMREVPGALEGFAAIESSAGAPLRAVELFAVADAFRRSHDAVNAAFEAAQVEEDLAHARAALEPDAFAGAWQAGISRSVETIVGEARQAFATRDADRGSSAR